MTRPFILPGHRSSHGNTVIEGASTTGARSQRIARLGDKVARPRHGHGGVTVIVTGIPSGLIDARTAACHGERTAGGATRLASQSLTTH